MNSAQLTVKPGAVALMALMAATRFHHFGTPFDLPDASLAVFFLAGLWLGGRYLFALLLAEAGLIDYLAIAQMGVSDFCISSAYIFLVPAYAAMWWGGKWCRRFAAVNFNALAQQAVALVSATSLAYLISNGSFYWLSGKFAGGNWTGFLESFAKYYPSYLQYTAIYAVTVFALVALGKNVLAQRATQHTH